jgi:hypothetical protein
MKGGKVTYNPLNDLPAWRRLIHTPCPEQGSLTFEEAVAVVKIEAEVVFVGTPLTTIIFTLCEVCTAGASACNGQPTAR